MFLHPHFRLFIAPSSDPYYSAENEREVRNRMDGRDLEPRPRVGTDDFPDVGPTSFEAGRRENLGRAEERLLRLLQSGAEIRYESARAAMMEVPLVWETDVERIVKDKADVIGMTKRERVPKPGHRLKLKSVQFDSAGHS